jgi:hypothetical protein
MNDDKTYFTVWIHLINGEKMCYRKAFGVDDVFNLGSQIENGLKANYLGMDMNGKLTIIPFQHILKIEIEPSPDALITHVIRNIEEVKE